MSEEKRPEQYWINCGPEYIVGVEGPVQGVRTNQAPVYEKVAELIRDLGIKQVVEVGCNVGQQALFLRRAGFAGEYLGIDSNIHAVKVAQQNLAEADHYAFEEGNLRWLDIRGYSKDTVISKDVIEHLESFDLLRNMLEIARRYVIIASFIPWFRREPSRIVKTQDGYYMNTYNLNEIKALAEECSFVVRDIFEVAAYDGTMNQVTVFERVKKTTDTPSAESEVIGEPVPAASPFDDKSLPNAFESLEKDLVLASLGEPAPSADDVDYEPATIVGVVGVAPELPDEHFKTLDVSNLDVLRDENGEPVYVPAGDLAEELAALKAQSAHPDDQAVANAAPKNSKPATTPGKSKGGKKN